MSHRRSRADCSDYQDIFLTKFGGAVNFVGWAIALSSAVFFICSSVRHALFQSNAFDLGIFDQGIYLISQGKPPICTLIGFHILGDHAAWILYPLALFYRIYPTVYWLFAIQAIALASGIWFTYKLSRQAGLNLAQSQAIAIAYILYPLVFNVNLFDFHPEVIALPAFLGAVLAVRLKRMGWFVSAILLILGCKAVLSLTVAAMGLWLATFERRAYGAIALILGTTWFFLASQVIIPFYRGGEPQAIGRYSYLGDSVLEVATNLVLMPGVVLSRVFSLDTLEYLLLLLVPLAWGLSLRHLAPLISAVPTLVLNILSDATSQRNLVHQYSLPILPFLLLAVISALAAGCGWLQTRRAIALWSTIAFLVLAKYGLFGSSYLDTLDTWQATRTAIAQVQPSGGVLTTAAIAPHLTHRVLIERINAPAIVADLTEFDSVLLNLRHPGGERKRENREFSANLLSQLKRLELFQLSYQQDDVYLFTKLDQP
jgi:uncharacterized membrane protein